LTWLQEADVASFKLTSATTTSRSSAVTSDAATTSLLHALPGLRGSASGQDYSASGIVLHMVDNYMDGGCIADMEDPSSELATFSRGRLNASDASETTTAKDDDDETDLLSLVISWFNSEALSCTS
jgi:folate-dependent phosphoribosylglycinamide formyltransferase PurN